MNHMTLESEMFELVWRRPAGEERADLAKIDRVRRSLESRNDIVEDHDGRWRVGERAVVVSIPSPKVRLLYRIVRSVRPTRVVEFGSALGVSGATIGAALERNGNGELVSYELSPERVAIANELISATTNRGEAIADSYLDHLDALDGADMLFFDGGKDEEAYRTVLGAAFERMTAPAVVVVDDVRSWKEVGAAWSGAENQFTATGVFADVGVGVIGDVKLDVRGTPRALLVANQAVGRVKGLWWRRRFSRAMAAMNELRASS